jgi:membrane-bound metal-dependent hydrolase YbcI (DUF457 family)
MDNLTHSLFALTLARTPLGRAGRGTTAALLLASNAPDSEIVAAAGGMANYLSWHRGMTHGPLGIVGFGVAVAGLVWAGRRIHDRRHRRERAAGAVGPDASFAMLATVAVIGVLLHVLMDFPTTYGTRLLSPFTWRWFSVDWMPIADIYLLIMLTAGLWFGRTSPAARRRNAAIVLMLMAANYGLRGAAHHRALTLVPRIFGPTLPPPCPTPGPNLWGIEAWPAPDDGAATPAPGKRCLLEAAAMPSFTSPFQWRIILHVSDAYEMRDINLLDGGLRLPEGGPDAPWRLTVRYQNTWTPAVTRAAAAPLAQVFLGFSRFPAARSAVDPRGVTTVRFADMRFAGRPPGINRETRRADTFTATVRVGSEGQILEETLGAGGALTTSRPP